MDSFEVEISRVVHGGYGIAKTEQGVIFVPHALPGDIAVVRLGPRRKGAQWATIERMVRPSPHRVAIDCPVFGRCGGCSWLDFGYPAQAEWKQEIVRDCFRRIAVIEVSPSWIEDPTLRHGYRTRAEFHGEGGVWGFFEEGTHRIVPIAGCPLCHARLNHAFSQLHAIAMNTSVELVANPEGEDVLAWTHAPNPELCALFPACNSPRDADRHQFLFDGAPIVNGGFSQSSLLLNRLLVRFVRSKLAGASRVLDLYCGNGNLTLTLEPAVEVLGLDHNAAVVRAADALRPGAYRVGRESEFRDALNAPWDVVILDPPRTGAKTLMPALARSTAGALIYVSCDPATLARDVRLLMAAGWRIEELAAIDLFPHTPHVESVCILRRN